MSHVRMKDGRLGIWRSTDSREKDKYLVQLKGSLERVRVSHVEPISYDEYHAPPKPVDTTKPKPAKRGGKK